MASTPTAAQTAAVTAPAAAKAAAAAAVARELAATGDNPISALATAAAHFLVGGLVLVASRFRRGTIGGVCQEHHANVLTSLSLLAR